MFEFTTALNAHIDMNNPPPALAMDDDAQFDFFSQLAASNPLPKV
jgi:hypothetical protein